MQRRIDTEVRVGSLDGYEMHMKRKALAVKRALML